MSSVLEFGGALSLDLPGGRVRTVCARCGQWWQKPAIMPYDQCGKCRLERLREAEREITKVAQNGRPDISDWRAITDEEEWWHSTEVFPALGDKWT